MKDKNKHPKQPSKQPVKQPTMNVITGDEGERDRPAFKINPQPPIVYKIDASKITSLEDVKIIFELLNLVFTPQDDEMYDKVKHLLKPV